MSCTMQKVRSCCQCCYSAYLPIYAATVTPSGRVHHHYHACLNTCHKAYGMQQDMHGNGDEHVVSV